ncbi:MAG: phosphopyruvate hydratase [Patescibacteria group bacterium]|nr:phosphopyruvate hydratase [Patescibacteria group bacterium]
MAKSSIKKLEALEILDSRGIPTVAVKVELSDGTKASASVPGGTSSGKFEAVELRDGDSARFGGKGVLKAVVNIEKKIFPEIKGMDVLDLGKIDRAMLELDGTKNKSRLGANATLGVSLACARAGAHFTGKPLYKHLRNLYKLKAINYKLPVPMFNLLNGGAHADSGMDVQEFMFVPQGESYAESLRWAAETFMQMKKLLSAKKLSTGVGLEGGFAPKLSGSKEAIELLIEAASAVCRVGKFRIALDVAASELFMPDKGEKYVFKREKASFSREQLLGWYAELIKSYPIESIEDGLFEEDWDGWAIMTAKLGDKVRVVGDDFIVTSAARLKKAIEMKALNTVLIKPNQIGTLTETMAAITLGQASGIKINLSHRSGETNDPFIADLAVAVGAAFIKAGATSRGERLAKYNRLLEIEEQREN